MWFIFRVECLPPWHTLWFPEFFGNDSRVVPICSPGWYYCTEWSPAYNICSPSLNDPVVPYDPIIPLSLIVPLSYMIPVPEVLPEWCPHPTWSPASNLYDPLHSCWFGLHNGMKDCMAPFPSILVAEIIRGSCGTTGSLREEEHELYTGIIPYNNFSLGSI